MSWTVKVFTNTILEHVGDDGYCLSVNVPNKVWRSISEFFERSPAGKYYTRGDVIDRVIERLLFLALDELSAEDIYGIAKMFSRSLIVSEKRRGG